MKKVIPYGRQNITEEDIIAVVETLNSDFLTQGPRIEEFENNFANYVGSKYAAAVSNGTAALHLCALALKLKKGQKVITSPITFAASANCIRYCDGEVVFSDIDPDTYLLDLEKVEKLLQNAKIGEYVGIIPVDFAGRAVDQEKVRKLADKYDLWVIEDACHAPGGYFVDSRGNNQQCGNGQFADLAIFSFHPVKHIAAGEGGMITTNSPELYKKICELRSHGIIRDQDLFQNSKEFAFGLDLVEEEKWPGWYMEMLDLGFNYRLTDFQAALGNSQLKRAAEGIERRRHIANIYSEELDNYKGIIRSSGVVEGHGYHLFVIEVENRAELYKHLREKNIFVQIHYIPTHLMPYYRQLGWREGNLPIAENYYKHCLSLPMFPTLKDTEHKYVIKTIKDFL